MLGWMSAQPMGAKRAMDGGGAYDGGGSGARTGLIEGTRLATAMGWRPVEAIAVGDKILTFDADLQRVTGITRGSLWPEHTPCPERFWPVSVPAGALGNRDAMHIPSHQPIMLESDAAEEIFGDPFVLVPAIALDGIRGITRTPPPEAIHIVVLNFAEDQVVFADNGALFFAPSSRDLLDRAMTEEDEQLYSVLHADMARTLLHQFKADFGTACVPHPHAPMAHTAA